MAGGDTRRDFIKKAAGATAVVASTNIFKTPVYGQNQAPSPGKVIGANDRIVVGYIGVGAQGTQHLRSQQTHAAENNITQAAVCDVYQKRLGAAKDLLKLSDGLTRIWPTLGFLSLGCLSLWFLQLSLRTIPLGTAYAVHAALPHLLDRAEGHIVILSSGAGHRSFPWAAVYGATKAAQRMFGEALWHELSGTGVSLTLVYPGEIATASGDHDRDLLPDWHRGDTRSADAGELAERVIAGVEADERAVYFPAAVRALGVLHGVSPALSDRVLRSLRGGTAAPRVD